jgi:hypothetical protein
VAQPAQIKRCNKGMADSLCLGLKNQKSDSPAQEEPDRASRLLLPLALVEILLTKEDWFRSMEPVLFASCGGN